MGSHQEKNIIQGVAIILGKGSDDMAEKKSLEYLNKLHSKIVRSPFAKNVTEQEMLALIEGKKTLEEVQQYRALGMTPEQVKEMQIEYCVKSTILEEYKALGTVEELRAKNEKLQGYRNQMSIYAEQHKIILASDVLDMLEELE